MSHVPRLVILHNLVHASCPSRDTRDDSDVRDILAQAEKVPPVLPVASVPLPPTVGQLRLIK